MSEESYIVPISRLNALNDGIFAVAMTILVLNIHLPSIQQVQTIGMYGFLETLFPELLIYFVSFILLGSFWLGHNSFSSLKKVNNTFSWLNILYLMCIALVPFSVSLGATFGDSIFAEIFFGVNIFLIGMLSHIIFFWGIKKGIYLEESLDDIKKINLDSLFYVLVPIIAILLSFVDNTLNFLF